MTSEALSDQFAELVADKLFTRISQGTQHWRSQAGSPLGRRHNAVVRDRIQRGEPGAAIVGRQHLLSSDALAEELQRLSSPKASRSKRAASNVVESLREELAPLETENG